MEHGDCHESLRLLLRCQQGGKLSQLHAGTYTPLCVHDTLGEACASRGVHDHGVILEIDVLVRWSGQLLASSDHVLPGSLGPGLLLLRCCATDNDGFNTKSAQERLAHLQTLEIADQHLHFGILHGVLELISLPKRIQGNSHSAHVGDAKECEEELGEIPHRNADLVTLFDVELLLELRSERDHDILALFERNPGFFVHQPETVPPLLHAILVRLSESRSDRLPCLEIMTANLGGCQLEIAAGRHSLHNNAYLANLFPDVGTFVGTGDLVAGRHGSSSQTQNRDLSKTKI